MISITEIEKLLNTENDHYNYYVFDLILEGRKSGLFENDSYVVESFLEINELFQRLWEKPIEAHRQFLELMKNRKATKDQLQFFIKWFINYIRKTEFDNIDLRSIYQLLRVENSRLGKFIDNDDVPNKTIRSEIKDLIQSEVELLPSRLKDLKPKEQIELLVKLLPFVIPKAESGNPVKRAGYDLNSHNWSDIL